MRETQPFRNPAKRNELFVTERVSNRSEVTGDSNVCIATVERMGISSVLVMVRTRIVPSESPTAQKRAGSARRSSRP